MKTVLSSLKTTLLILMACILSEVAVAQTQPYGNALKFDGVDDYVRGTLATDPGFQYEFEFTMEAWVKLDAAGQFNIIAIGDPSTSQNPDLLSFGYATNNTIFLKLANFVQGEVRAYTLPIFRSLRLVQSHWNHIAVAASYNKFSVYLNGVAILSNYSLSGNAVSPFYYGQKTVVNLGKRIKDINGNPLLGSLDEVKLWKTARTQQQIIDDMNSPVTDPVLNPDLMLYYDFNDHGVAGADNTGSTAAGTLIDHSQYALNGTLNGFALTGGVSNWVNSYAMVIPTVADATGITPTGFTANWVTPAVNSLDNFKLMVATDALFTQVVPGYDSIPTAGNETSLAITGLQPGIQYYYRVRPDKASVPGVGAFSAGTAVKTIGVPQITSFTPTYGPAGTQITISGTNFNFTSAVSFGGTSAVSFNLVNDNTLTATIGTGTTGPIAITTPAGTGTSANSFTFIIPLLVTGISPASGSMGSVITITGQGFTNASAVRFGGTAPGSFTVVNDNTITAVITNGATGDVVVTNGTDYTLPAAFTYVSTLLVTGVEPADARAGTMVTLTGQGFTGASAVSFGGTPALSFNVVSNTQITAIVGIGSSGDVTVLNGTSYTLQAAFTYAQPDSSPNTALHFDGVDDYIKVTGRPFRIVSGGAFSLGFWMKTDQHSTATAVGLIDAETGNGVADFGVYMVNGKLVARTGGPYDSNIPGYAEYSVTSQSYVNTGHWVYVTVVHDGGAQQMPYNGGKFLKLYINGGLEVQSLTPSDVMGASQFFTIGASTSLAVNSYYRGLLDEIRVQGGDKSAAVMDAMVTGYSVDAAVGNIYHFDQGVPGGNNNGATTLVDHGVRTLTGQLYNFELQGSTSNWVESYSMVVAKTKAATNLTSNGFTANWSAPETGTADSFKLTVASDANFTQILPEYNNVSLANTVTSLAITGLTPLTSYYYRVCPNKASAEGQGAYSLTIKVVTPSLPSPPPGNALEFNGINNYVRVPIQLGKAFTIGFWMKTTQIGAGNAADQWYQGTGLVDGDLPGTGASDFGISLLGNKLAFGYGNVNGSSDKTGVSSSDVNTGKWVHVEVEWQPRYTYSGDWPILGSSYARIYINGVLETTFSGDGFFDRLATSLTIGANDDLSHYFKGSIDELKFYNENRDQKNLKSPAYATYSQMYNYYSFDQGIPGQNNAGLTTLFDNSLKGNDGTLYNFDLNGSSSNWVGSYAMVVPSALAATSIRGQGFIANWAKPVVGIADNFKITVATDADFTQIVPGCDSLVAPGTVTSLPIAGLSGGTTYYYRVRAFITNGAGQGNYSNTISLTTGNCTPGEDMLAADTNEGAGNMTSGQNLVLMVDGSGCREVASVQSMGSSPVAGGISAQVWIEDIQPAKYVRRHYEIAPATNAATATGKVTLYFTQEEFDDFNDANSNKLPTGPGDTGGIGNLRIEKRKGTSSDGSGLPNTYTDSSPDTFKPSDRNGSVSWNASADRWEVSFEVSGFSGFFAKSVETALPLRLMAFTVIQENSTNKLQWQTADEVNTQSFELQSSKDSRDFQKIVTIQTVGSGSNSYEYVDATTYTGMLYYRLKMIDLDGTFTHSRMVWLSREGKAAINLYPNPATEGLILSIDNGLINSEARLYNKGGKLLQIIRITSSQQLINLRTLPAGVYILRFVDGSVCRFAKQ